MAAGTRRIISGFSSKLAVRSTSLTQLLFAIDFKHISQDMYDAVKEQLDEVERILAGLIRSVSNSMP